MGVAEASFSPLAQEQIEGLSASDRNAAWQAIRGIEQDPFTKDVFHKLVRVPDDGHTDRMVDLSVVFIAVTFEVPKRGSRTVGILSMRRVGFAW